MPCTTITSILKGDCNNNIGGIYTLYVIDQEYVTGTTVNVSAHTITAMTLTATQKFATVDFKRNVGNFTVEHTEDLVTGNGAYKASVNITLNRREGVKSRTLQILSEGQRYLSLVVLGADGTYTYFNDAQLISGAENSGTARNEGTNYTLVFSAEMNNRPYFVTPAIMPALIA